MSQCNSSFDTYFLPVGRRLGLRSPSLSAANTYSTGAAEYEYGPENSTGTPSLGRRFFSINLLECQAALSRRIREDSYQPGVSLSSCRNSCRRKSVITSASVFACVSEHQIRPSVSRAASKDILGATYLSVMEPAPSVGTQILRRKRV